MNIWAPSTPIGVKALQHWTGHFPGGRGWTWETWKGRWNPNHRAGEAKPASFIDSLETVQDSESSDTRKSSGTQAATHA